MRQRSSALATSCVLAFSLSMLDGCGSGDDNTVVLPVDASTDRAATDATTEGSTDGRSEGGEGGGGGSEAGEGGGVKPAFLAHFDLAQKQQPEGLWTLGDAGTPVVGFAPLATLVTVTADGGSRAFGAIGDAGAANTFTLGITSDTTGNVYVGVGAAGAGPVPSPGIYKFAPGGGAAALFSSATGMNFPNGLDFIGTTLFVADSTGTVYAIDASGHASVWSADSLLAPDMAACDGGIPLAIGANGIVHDANNVYVTNTNHGRIIKIPMAADGGAGVATAIVDDCTLAGADGLVLDTRDNSLLVAVNIQNKIVRVPLGGDGGAVGQTTTVASGSPLDAPASVIIDSATGARRLLFTNSAFFSGDAGQPGLLALPLP
jgi:sugar lactone lactonase YvrE